MNMNSFLTSHKEQVRLVAQKFNISYERALFLLKSSLTFLEQEMTLEDALALTINDINSRSAMTWCKIMGIKKYNIVNGQINVDDDVILDDMSLKCLPHPFGVINGIFSINFNPISSFKNFPIYIRYSLFCTNTNITSFKGITKKVIHSIVLSNNNINSKSSKHLLDCEFYNIDVDDDLLNNEYFKYIMNLRKMKG